LTVTLFLSMMVQSGLASCNTGTPPYDRVCFQFEEDPIAWFYAPDVCRLYADDLLKVDSPETIDFASIETGAKKRHAHWTEEEKSDLGIRAVTHNPDSVYIYTSLVSGKADDGTVLCKVLEVRGDQTWHEEPCLSSYNYVCEKG
ncbi:unnamed protein product, partial [Candidula unifasciata]